MKRDNHLETEKIISSLGNKRPRLLLQCCCGPCGSYVLEYLCRHFEVTAVFYNPNIYPQEEYDKRLFWLIKVLEANGVKLLDCPYEPERFQEVSKGLEAEPEGGARCEKCFRLRLSETARRAKAGNFDYFCTTLTVSPHKDQERINALGQELEKEFGVKWLPSDFKKREGYKRSIELSRSMGLYRQTYCGCIFSLREEQEREKTR